jgi:hypothetical protein
VSPERQGLQKRRWSRPAFFAPRTGSFSGCFSRRAYPQNTGREEREAKARLLSVIFNDDVPESRD